MVPVPRGRRWSISSRTVAPQPSASRATSTALRRRAPTRAGPGSGTRSAAMLPAALTGRFAISIDGVRHLRPGPLYLISLNLPSETVRGRQSPHFLGEVVTFGTGSPPRPQKPPWSSRTRPRPRPGIRFRRDRADSSARCARSPRRRLADRLPPRPAVRRDRSRPAGVLRAVDGDRSRPAVFVLARDHPSHSLHRTTSSRSSTCVTRFPLSDGCSSS